jgi:heme exporter protein A
MTQAEPAGSFSIELRAVSKRFGAFAALRDISARIGEGDRISLIGHNGAGKSTLLNLVATLSRPSAGDLVYRQDEKELTRKPEIRAKLSYLSHEAMLYPDLTAMENLRFAAELYHGRADDQRLHTLLERVGMARAGDRLIRTCSRGMQQRLSIARALLPEPRLMLLDEPFSGLDSEGVRRLGKLFTAEDSSWLMVTHDLEMGYTMANRFWILKRGRLTHDLRKSDLDHDTYLGLSRAATLTGVTR